MRSRVAFYVTLVALLLLALLFSTLTNRIPFEWIGVALSAALYIFLGYLGWSIGIQRRNAKRRSRAEIGGFYTRPVQSFYTLHHRYS